MAKKLNVRKVKHLISIGIDFHGQDVYLEDLLSLLPDFIRFNGRKPEFCMDKNGISYEYFDMRNNVNVIFSCDNRDLLEAAYKTVCWLNKKDKASLMVETENHS